ncbi:putative DNA primase large subunit [Diplonema papillatum]|nr:putative DNA primase large subunit [Diplonema papillatum]
MLTALAKPAGQREKEAAALPVAALKNACMELKPSGWFSMYEQPAKGTRNMQEFEELTMRRIAALRVLDQEEGLERMTKEDVLKEISAAATGNKTTYCKGVFEWVAPLALEAQLFTADVETRYEHKVDQSLVNAKRKHASIGMYSTDDSDESYAAYEREWRTKKAELIGEAYKTAFEDDCIGHWAGRLAFCGEERWRRWFVKHEETLFKGRVLALPAADQATLLKWHAGLVEKPADDIPEEVRGMLAEMQQRFNYAARKKTADEVLRTSEVVYYEIPFENVPNLVKDRKVVLHKGTAYVPHPQALSVLWEKFREAVERGLEAALHARPEIDAREKDRVSAFLNRALLDSSAVMERGRQKNAGPSAALDIEDIADHAQTHMPLCMRMVDRTLRAEKHLKFDGRFQYGNFLKHAGLSLEHAMKFFAETMTLRTNPTKFAKSEYGYSVRYWYGKEGKKTSYNAQNCSTLIMSAAPKPGQCHGCPFKHLPEARLRALIKEPRPHPAAKAAAPQQAILHQTITLSDSKAQDILKKVQSSHYPAACREYFVATHPGYPKDASLFVSPNQYYSTSVEWMEEQAKQSKPT